MKERLTEFVSRMTKEVYEEIEPKTKVHYHARLQKVLVNSAVNFNLKGVPEYKLMKVKGYEKRKGQIDIVWLNADRSPTVAIEIDSSLREKSMMKLLSSNALYKIQIYYGKKPESLIQRFKDSYDPGKEIIFVHLPLDLLRSKDVEIFEQYTLFD